MRSSTLSVPQLIKRIAAADTALRSGSLADPKAAAAHVRADSERMAALLTAADIDAAAVDAAAKESAAERVRLQDGARARAIAASPGVAKRLAALSAVPVDLAPPTQPWQPGSFILEDANFMRAWPDTGALHDSAVGQNGNSGEYRLQVSAEAVGDSDAARLSFYFLWRNPRAEDVFVDISARLMVNAHLMVNADWNGVAAWAIGHSHANATVRARLSLWPLWIESGPIVTADQIISQISAEGGFFGSGDDDSIAFSQLLGGGGFAVPAGRWVMIEVSLVTEWHANSGSIDLDAESGSFRVDCPAAIVIVPTGAAS